MNADPSIRVVVGYEPGIPSREKPARIVQQWFEQFGWPLVVQPAVPGIPVNAGWLKNRGVAAHPDGNPHDVFVLADADCVCPEAQLRHAIYLAYQAPGLVWVADEIRITTRDDMAGIESAEDAIGTPRGHHRLTDSTPQLLAIRRDAFAAVGGYDEAYVGYGFEDYDFRKRCGDRWPHRNVKGHMVHLWHEPDPEKVNPGEVFRANEERYFGPSGAPWRGEAVRL